MLDRDDGAAHPEAHGPEDTGLEFFTWGRRHIESYLLVPPAIGRALRLPADDSRIERALRAILPEPDEETRWLDLDAKRVLAPAGPLARALGSRLRPAAIARAMRPSELHPDVRACVDRLCEVFGLRPPVP